MKACSAVVALVAAALAAIGYRGQLLWCGARGIPLGTFWRRPGFSADQMPPMDGLVALVTGANSGLGLEVSRQLLRANATVVLACRDVAKCEAAAQTLRAEAAALAVMARPDVRVVHVDLSDLRQVGRAAQTLDAELGALDLLVANAGVAAQFPLTLTPDGVEQTFQSNFLGHFALVTRLLPLLERSSQRRGAPSRVVHLTSGAHRGAPPGGVSGGLPLTLDGVNDDRVGAYARYGTAKLASLAFSAELSRRRRHRGLLSVAVHPGVVATSLLRRDNFGAMLGPVFGPALWGLAQARNALFAYLPQRAALSVLYAAVSAELEQGGAAAGHQLIVPVATPWPPHHAMATDAAFGAALWEFSEGVVARATAFVDA